MTTPAQVPLAVATAQRSIFGILDIRASLPLNSESLDTFNLTGKAHVLRYQFPNMQLIK